MRYDVVLYSYRIIPRLTNHLSTVDIVLVDGLNEKFIFCTVWQRFEHRTESAPVFFAKTNEPATVKSEEVVSYIQSGVKITFTRHLPVYESHCFMIPNFHFNRKVVCIKQAPAFDSQFILCLDWLLKTGPLCLERGGLYWLYKEHG